MRAILPTTWILIGVTCLGVLGAPSPKADQQPEIPPLITFKDGKVGVNFLGFKASAGLGGLLTGDASHGGLQASAETPFGQKAQAGLGGRVDGNGRSLGGLYAGATAGGGVGAQAGLDGTSGADGSFGRSYAGASAGGVGKAVVKESYRPNAVGGASASSALVDSSVNIQKVPSHASAPSVSSSTTVEVAKHPSVKSRVEIELVKEPKPIKKTYVERTVIPNYVEKTIQVPSYVEKTVRVPTVVHKTVKVPASPTIIEKEIEVPKEVEAEVPVVPTTTIVKTKTKYRRRPWLHYRKRINVQNIDAPYYGGVVAAEVDAPVSKTAEANFGAFGNLGYAGGEYAPQSTYTVRKQFNGNLVRDIFNIPISTLQAVSNLVGNIASTNGGVAISKTYESTKY